MPAMRWMYRHCWHDRRMTGRTRRCCSYMAGVVWMTGCGALRAELFHGFYNSIPKDLLPASQQGTHGMQVGLYRVEVIHPERNIAAKYNTDTELSVDL